ncbi:MAG: hypothetical protein AAFV98_23435, partial [Chloroflexota bacterium]
SLLQQAYQTDIACKKPLTTEIPAQNIGVMDLFLRVLRVFMLKNLHAIALRPTSFKQHKPSAWGTIRIV